MPFRGVDIEIAPGETFRCPSAIKVLSMRQNEPLKLSTRPSLAEKLALEDGLRFSALSIAAQDRYRKKAREMILAADRPETPENI